MSTRPLRVLLTGANGCVGRAILARAAQEPGRWEIVAVHRGEAPPAGAGVTPLRATLEELPGRLDDAGPVDVCIHAAAAVHNSERDAAGFFAVNRDQTLALADALAGRAGFRRFVFVSTVAVLEQAGRADPTPYAASKRDAENALAARAAAGAFALAVLRLGTVYGPADRGNLGALFRAVARRRYLRLAPPGTRKTLVSSRRVAAAALLAAAVEDLPAGPWLVADGEPYPLAEVEDALAAAAGVPPPPRLPGPLGWGVSALGSVLASAGLPAPLTLGRLKTLARPVSYHPEPAAGPVAEALRAADTRTLAEAFRDAYVRGVD